MKKRTQKKSSLLFCYWKRRVKILVCSWFHYPLLFSVVFFKNYCLYPSLFSFYLRVQLHYATSPDSLSSRKIFVDICLSSDLYVRIVEHGKFVCQPQSNMSWCSMWLVNIPCPRGQSGNKRDRDQVHFKSMLYKHLLQVAGLTSTSIFSPVTDSSSAYLIEVS